MASNSNFSHPPPQSEGSTGPSGVPKEKSSWLSKLIVILSIILFLCLFTWLALLPNKEPLPGVTLSEFYVSNFQTLDSRLVAEWVANFSIKKIEYISSYQNYVSVYYSEFEYIECLVSYKGHILAVNSTNVVQEKIRSYVNMSVKFSTKGLEGDQREVKGWVLEDIRKERDNGTLIFGMQLVMWTPRYRSSYWARCLDLMVDFNQLKWVATNLDSPKSGDCNISNWNSTLHSLY